MFFGESGLKSIQYFGEKNKVRIWTKRTQHKRVNFCFCEWIDFKNGGSWEMINIFDEMVMCTGVFHDDIRIHSRTFPNAFVFQLFDFKSWRYGGVWGWWLMYVGLFVSDGSSIRPFSKLLVVRIEWKIKNNFNSAYAVVIDAWIPQILFFHPCFNRRQDDVVYKHLKLQESTPKGAQKVLQHTGSIEGTSIHNSDFAVTSKR